MLRKYRTYAKLQPCYHRRALVVFLFNHLLTHKLDILVELDLTHDNHAFLVLQPAVEAFFIVHAPYKLTSEAGDNSKETQDPFR